MKYRSGYKYQLYKTEVFSTRITPPKLTTLPFILLYPSGKLIVKRFYAWDGASGPTIDTKNSMRASLFHDAVTQLMRLGVLDKKWRITSNEEMEYFLKQDGMWWLRRKIWLKVLNWFGESSIDPKNKKLLLEAP